MKGMEIRLIDLIDRNKHIRFLTSGKDKFPFRSFKKMEYEGDIVSQDQKNPNINNYWFTELKSAPETFYAV